MTLGLVIWVGGALVALAIGVWLGMPGRYTQSVEDIQRVMDAGGAVRRKRVKRSLSPFAWMQRRGSANATRRSRAARSQGSSRRGGFKLESPEDR